MNLTLEDNLNTLYLNQKLNKPIVIWGIGVQTEELVNGIHALDPSLDILMILDNFKDTFLTEYKGIPVKRPYALHELEKDSFIVFLSVNYAEAIRKQLNACGVTEVYNLRNMEEDISFKSCDLPYHFINRSKNRENLCYILAGYEPVLWENTLGRIEAFQSNEIDYCIVSSGKYDETLNQIALRNNWSYLYTDQNQVCYIQNLVIELHPAAEYIIKMDEDIFIGRNFFNSMVAEFHKIEKEGDYRIGFAAPVIPLNCSGYVSYLKLSGTKNSYEHRFGRAYKSRFSAVFNVVETAEFLWDTMDTFDSMADQFALNKGYEICDCYFNIGCIMYTRERWLMMGKWPENPDDSGMGTDEGYIYSDNVEKDLSIYEIKSVLVGHLAFGHQKERMMAYYKKNSAKFSIKSEADL